MAKKKINGRDKSNLVDIINTTYFEHGIKNQKNISIETIQKHKMVHKISKKRSYGRHCISLENCPLFSNVNMIYELSPTFDWGQLVIP